MLLPGALGLAGLAFSARRKRWLSRMALVGLVGFVGLLGTTACAPRYNYYNHGPPFNLPTPIAIARAIAIAALKCNFHNYMGTADELCSALGFSADETSLTD